MKRKPRTKIQYLLLCAALLFALMPVPVQAASATINLATVSADGTGYTWDATNGVLTLTGSGSVDTYTITTGGAETSRRISISTAAPLTITLDNVNIKTTTGSPLALVYGGQDILILNNTNILTTTAENCAGIQIPESLTSLTIEAGVGNAELTVQGGYCGAGIGGGNNGDGGIITINSGSITATGGYCGAGIGGGNNGDGGAITIENGIVNAQGGGYAAGIGGGSFYYTTGRSCGTIIIDGGTINATGGSYAAGIGGGCISSGGTVTINGGSIIAAGANGGAGIGGGSASAGSTGTISGMNISGGTVNATGSGWSTGAGAGIGGGGNSPGCDVVISGGTVTASGCIYVTEYYGTYSSAGIGGGSSGSGGTVVVSGGSVLATGGSGSENIGAGKDGASSGSLTNGSSSNVYLNTLTIPNQANKTITAGSINGVSCAETADAPNGVYGIKDVKTDSENKLYFYLPSSASNETVKLKANNIEYEAAYTRLANHSNAQTLTEILTYTATINPTAKTFSAATVGYGEQTAQEFTVTNTGTGTIDSLNASLSGTNFEIGTALSSTSVNGGSTATLSVRPKTNLAVGTYTDTLTVTGSNSTSLSASLSFTVEAPTYTATINPTTKTFSAATVGYGEQTAQEFTVTNTGTGTIDSLNASLSGTNFEISTMLSSTSVNGSGTATLSVRPKTNLAVGTYTDTLTVTGSNSISLSASLSLMVNEVIPIHTVTVSGSHASVTGAGSYEEGDTVTINAGSYSNYKFGGWTSSSDGVTFANADSASTTFTMPENDVTVTASWIYIGNPGGGGSSGTSYSYYVITASSGTGGTISPAGSLSVQKGLDKIFTITADSGYRISDVLVDGVSVGAVSTYTFKEVIKNHTISVIFEKIVFNPFTDVAEGDWFYDNVLFVYEQGLMNGIGNSNFSPYGNMTRAMFATMLYRLSGDTGSYINTFSDIPSGAWYENAIGWAAANRIVSGTGNNCFSPDNKITREQLAVMLYSYAKYKGYDISIGETNILSYNDAFYISDYAYSALQWACDVGIISGDDKGNLNPQDFATRAEAAAILQRFLENIKG